MTNERVEITRPDKLLWPALGITKRAYADYLAAVAEHLLPWLRDRPLSVIRAPDGVDKTPVVIVEFSDFECAYCRRNRELIRDLQARHRDVLRGSPIEGRGDELARRVDVSPIEGGLTAVKQLFRLSLPFSYGAARALDVRTGAGMSAIEKQHARPDMNRLLVTPAEIVIEAGQQKLLNFRVPVHVGLAGRRGTRFVS